MLNPYPFPLLAYPGLAPELALRSGMGGWEPYALPAPADRLLPFVVTRTQSPTNPRWLNCARIEHADTGALLFTLEPTGYTESLGSLDLPFRKYADAEAQVDHFVYFGGLITGLALPCGTPLRLVIDNEWQSPRFRAVPDLKDYMLVEWWDNGPANNVPYGTGFRQRLYVPHAGLQFSEPTEERETTKIATGGERLDYLAKIRNAVFTAPLVPAYLAEAISGAEATGNLQLDGETWEFVSVKSNAAGDDGGRWNMIATVRQVTPLVFRASCPAPALEDAGYDASTDAARPYRCGDSSDTAPDILPDGVGVCETNNDDENTGYILYTTKDANPYSASFGQVGPPMRSAMMSDACPVPVVYQSELVTRPAIKNDCPDGQTGSQEVFVIPAGAYTSNVSQAAATQLAIDAALAGRQAYANANGTCNGGTPGASYQPVYDPETGCFTCLMVNTTDPDDVRAATLLEVSHYRIPNVYYNGAPYFCPDCA